LSDIDRDEMNHQSIDARFNAHTNPLSLFTKDAKKIAFAFARDAPLARSHRPFDDPCLARATNWSVARDVRRPRPPSTRVRAMLVE